MSLAYQEYYTVSDYKHWQDNWELIEGMPYAMAPSPSVSHQTVSFNIASVIREAFAKNAMCSDRCTILLETDWEISNDTVVRPDVMVVCQPLEEVVRVTPALIVEVVSVSSSKRDEQIKFELYQREGVSYYLLAYPDKRLAKVYFNGAYGFKKVADYSEENADFVLGDCSFAIQFASVWREDR